MSRSVQSLDGKVRPNTFESISPRAAISVLLLGALSYAYFSAAISIASNKNLWMDEALAVSTALLSSWSETWSAIWSGAEFSPPTYHFFLHELLTRFNSYPEALVARVPSILAVYVAGVCVLALVRASTIGLAELIWLATRREMRWGVWLSLLAAAPFEAAWYPLGQHLKGFLLQDSGASDYYGKPTVGLLAEALFQSLASDESVAVLTVFALALAGAACVLARHRPSIVARDAPSPGGAEITRLEITAIALFSIPFVSFLFSLLLSSSFAVRYASAASLFPGVFYGCAMRRMPYSDWIAFLLAPLVVGSLLLRQEDFNSGLLAPAQSVLAAAE